MERLDGCVGDFIVPACAAAWPAPAHLGRDWRAGNVLFDAYTHGQDRVSLLAKRTFMMRLIIR